MIIKQKKSLDLIMKGCLFLYFFFAFFAQYTSFSIPRVMSTLCVLLLIFDVINLHRLSFYRNLGIVFLFGGYIIINSFLFALNRQNALENCVNLIAYMSVMTAIYIYVESNTTKLLDILWGLTIPISCLALFVLVAPTTLRSGAITFGSLNVNDLSSYIAVGITADLVLLSYYFDKKTIRSIILASIVIEIIAQILCASRRGIIVVGIIILGYIYFFIDVRNRKHWLKRILILLVVGLIIFMGLSDIVENTDLVVVQRLTQHENTVAGDIVRKRIQGIAYELFKQYPIFGTGYGYMTAYAGLYSHHMYLELLACTGVVGLLIIISYIVYSGVFFWLRGKTIKDPRYSLMSQGVFLLVVSTLAGGLANVYIYHMHFYVMLAIIAATRNVIMNLENDEIAQ